MSLTQTQQEFNTLLDRVGVPLTDANGVKIEKIKPARGITINTACKLAAKYQESDTSALHKFSLGGLIPSAKFARGLVNELERLENDYDEFGAIKGRGAELTKLYDFIKAHSPS